MPQAQVNIPVSVAILQREALIPRGASNLVLRVGKPGMGSTGWPG